MFFHRLTAILPDSDSEVKPDEARGITRHNYKSYLPFAKSTPPHFVPNVDTYRCIFDRTAPQGVELETITKIFAAPRRTVKYSFVIDTVPANMLYETLYFKPNGDWSINEEDNNVANTAIFTIETITEASPIGNIKVAKIKTATDLALVQNLPEILTFKIRALVPDKPAEFDDAVVTQIVFDLNIDSDNNNNNNFDNPDHSKLEEFLEDHPYGLGKLVMQNHSCPNPANFFTPLRIYLPQELDMNDVDLKIRLNFSPSSQAGGINLWKVNKNQSQLPNKPLAFNATHSLDDLNYDPNTGTINLFVAGGYQCPLTKWTNVEQNGRPDEFITATLVVNGNDVYSDKVKYLVVQNPSFFYRLQFDNTTLPYRHSQHFRCLLASKGIYSREDLPQYCLKLLDNTELRELGLPKPIADVLSKKHNSSWWNYSNQIYGFNAGIYRDYISQKYILTFAGTEPTQMAHWMENIWQGLGNAITQGQYETAMEIAHYINKMSDPPETDVIAKPSLRSNLIITGHSLGGGLASAAYCVSGAQAITFNAAGLHKNTLYEDNNPNGTQRYPADPASGYPGAVARFNDAAALIRAYHVDYDILTQLQKIGSAVIPEAIGQPIELDGDQDAVSIVSVSVLVAGLASGATLAGAIGGAVYTYAGYKCHTLERLLYGFLVKESPSGLGIDEDLLGLPI